MRISKMALAGWIFGVSFDLACIILGGVGLYKAWKFISFIYWLPLFIIFALFCVEAVRLQFKGK